jgi:hypothetical protein
MTTPAPLATVEGVKAQLNIPAEDTRYDGELAEYIDAATVLVEEYRQEAVVLRSVTERLAFGWATVFTLRTTPVARLVSVTRTDDGAVRDVADLRVDDAATGAVSVVSGDPLSGTYEIVYEAGYAIIPANIALATKFIVAHLWESQQQPAIGPRALGSGEDTMTPGGQGWGLPDRAIALLGKRPPMVA